VEEKACRAIYKIIILHRFWIHHNSKKNYRILLPWQYAQLLIIMKHSTKFQVSRISHLRREVSTRYFTPHPSWIHHNSKKNYWILLSWRYVLMIIKHCTKFQISMISRLVGEVSTRFSDRQTDGQTESTKTIRLPQDGGRHNSIINHCLSTPTGVLIVTWM
jgi:hypothetical protein